MASYDAIAATDDVIGFIEAILNVTLSEDDLPPILQFDLWKKDFQDFLRSTLNGSQDLDFTL